MHGLWGMRQMMFSKYIVVVNVDGTATALQADGGNTHSVGRPKLQWTARPNSVRVAHE